MDAKVAGYQALCDFVQGGAVAAAGDKFAYVGFKNVAGVELFRVAVSDSKCAWTHAVNSHTLELTTTLTGADIVTAGVAIPTVVHTSAFYSASVGGNQLTQDELLRGDGDVASDWSCGTSIDTGVIKTHLAFPQGV